MNRAILFRFHKNIQFCFENLCLIRELNPDIPIYGVGEEIQGVERLYNAGLSDLYVIEDKPPRWKWLNGDLVFRRWFDSVGSTKNFDILHIIEWDLLLTKPVDEIYDNIDTETILMSGLIELEKARKYDWDWVIGDNYNKYEYLLKIARERLGYTGKTYGGILPGLSVPYTFLKEYTNTDIPVLCNDEARIGIFGPALGYEMADTGFYNGWGKNHTDECFNCKNSEVDCKTVAKKDRNVFHPVRDIEVINNL